MTSLNLSTFNFESVTKSVIIEGLEHLASYVQDTDFDGYLCDLSNESMGCDPYVIYHAKAKEWLKNHSLDTFDVIEDIRDYHSFNFGEFNLEITPENIVTAYMEVVLSDIVGIWLVAAIEDKTGDDLWSEEITKESRAAIVEVLGSEIKNFEKEL